MIPKTLASNHGFVETQLPGGASVLRKIIEAGDSNRTIDLYAKAEPGGKCVPPAMDTLTTIDYTDPTGEDWVSECETFGIALVITLAISNPYALEQAEDGPPPTQEAWGNRTAPATRGANTLGYYTTMRDSAEEGAADNMVDLVSDVIEHAKKTKRFDRIKDRLDDLLNREGASLEQARAEDTQ